jgi:hypothetical protein
LTFAVLARSFDLAGRRLLNRHGGSAASKVLRARGCSETQNVSSHAFVARFPRNRVLLKFNRQTVSFVGGIVGAGNPHRPRTEVHVLQRALQNGSNTGA